MLSLEGGVSSPARFMQNRVSPTCAHMQPGHLPEFCGSLFASCPEGKVAIPQVSATNAWPATRS